MTSVAVAVAVAPARAADPDHAAVSPAAPDAAWEGRFDTGSSSWCTNVPAPACDRFTLDVHGDDTGGVFISVSAQRREDDLDLYVYNSRGYLVTSATAGANEESVVLGGQPARYRIEVHGKVVRPGATYVGRATWASGLEGPLDREMDCREVVPAAVALPAGEAPATVDVHVLLDGVPEAVAAEAMETAATVFAPEGVELVVSRYEAVAFAADEPDGNLVSTELMFHQAKEHVGGARPRGADVVYVMTSKDLRSAAGMADCIGGVRFPHRAFAIGETMDPLRFDEPIPDFYVDATATIAAHEIAHLLGAHHHYANCAEAAPQSARRSHNPTAVCTLMVNFGDFASLTLSSLNGAIVFGHADAFAR